MKRTTLEDRTFKNWKANFEKLMKAIAWTKYRSLDVLHLQEVEGLANKYSEVLIRVDATTVNCTKSIYRKGEPIISRIFTGLASQIPVPDCQLNWDIPTNP